MQHATQQDFPLARYLNRVALLLSIHAGVTTLAEIEAAVLQDSQPRPRAKPIVAWGVRYASITECARERVQARRTRWNKDDYYSAVNSEKQYLARLCKAGPSTGVYWSV